MKKEEIKKQINDAVRIFKETLEFTYLQEGKEKAFYGIGTHWLSGLLCGKINFHRLNNGNLRISGELGKEMFNEKCKGLPNKFEDYDIFPMVITLFNKNIGVKEKK